MSLSSERSDDPPRRQPRHRDPNAQPGHSILRTSYTGDVRNRGEGSSRLGLAQLMGLESDSSSENRQTPITRPSLRPKRDIPPFLSMEIPVRIPQNIEDAEIDKLGAEIASKIKLARARYVAETMAPRPTGKPEDYPDFRTAGMSSRWLAGKDYGPIVDPVDFANSRAKLFVHPVLASGSKHLLRWNMICPPLDSGPTHQLPPGFSEEPATYPRLSSIKLVSPFFPWEIDISASSRSMGVTCGDVLNKIDLGMFRWLSGYHLADVSDEFKAALHEAGQARNSAFPRRTGGLRQIDWLVGRTIFGGLVEDKDFVRQRFRVSVPATLLLCCQEEQNR